MRWFNYLINQPNNFLANTLGLGSQWSSSIVGSNTTRKYTTLYYIFFNYYMRIIFKSGLMWRQHPFIHNIFNYFESYLHINSLPNYITKLTIVKFFRIRRLRLGSDIRLKSQFVYRNFKNFLNISRLNIFFLNSWILLSLHAYIPIIYKRRVKLLKRVHAKNLVGTTQLPNPLQNLSNTGINFKLLKLKELMLNTSLNFQFQLLSIF